MTHRPQATRQPHCLVPISSLLLLGAWLVSSQAQVQTAIRPDGSLHTAVTQTGSLYEITGGTRPGNGPNLFHSFDRFRIGTDDTARFTGPTGIANILSRVTGGEQSIIDGRLQSAIPGANFYLLSPSGVLFGPNASLDVSGSFHVSTADYLRLADGGTFSAHLGGQSTLTVAPPVAFGFLRENPQGISIQGSTLAVPDGRTMSVVGGEVQMVGGSLKAPNGQIHLASITAVGEVPANLSELNAGTVPRLGTVALSEGARLDASSVQGGGTVVIRGGRLLMDNARIRVATEGDVNGAPTGVDVQVTGEAVLTNRAEITANSGLFSNTASMGNAGAITLEAGRLTLTDGAIMSSTTFGPGRGGSVTVRATEVVTLAGSDPITGSPSGIFAIARGMGEGAGDAGMVSVEAATVTLTDGAQVGNRTFGSGRGGSVTVRATEAVTLKSFTLVGSALVPTGIGATTLGAGDAGAVLVEAATITITDGAQLGGGTFGSGRGGSVTVRTTEALTLKGASLEGSFLSPSGISAVTLGAGDAGAVLVEAATITITDGAQIRGGTFGSGRSGSVTVRATEAVTLGSPSPMGRLAIPSGVKAEPIGLGGTLAFTATVITPGRVINGLLTDARGSGPGGDLTVHAPIIQLRDGATIAAANTGTGNAGNITITATDTFLSERGTVTTAAIRGDGGNIQVTAPSLIRLRDSEITATVGGGRETVGGNITLNSEFVVLKNSQIRANAFEGRGGKIQITAGVFLADPASQVSASSTLGINGAVDIRAPVADLSGSVTPLPQQFAQAAALLRDRCAARLQEGTVSSLVERGRDGVPANPDGVLPSRLYKAHAESSKPPRIGRQGKTTTASAQRGLSRDADGHLQIKDWPTLAGSPLAWEQECAGR